MFLVHAIEISWKHLKMVESDLWKQHIVIFVKIFCNKFKILLILPNQTNVTTFLKPDQMAARSEPQKSWRSYALLLDKPTPIYIFCVFRPAIRTQKLVETLYCPFLDLFSNFKIKKFQSLFFIFWNKKEKNLFSVLQQCNCMNEVPHTSADKVIIT